MPQDGRTPEERLADRALLLLTLNFGERVGRIDSFRLMKIPFVVQHQLNCENIRSFSYRFFREQHGPISKAIYEDRDLLRDAGLIDGGSSCLNLTKLGDRLSRLVLNFLTEETKNNRIMHVLQTGAQRYASLSTWEAIKAEVYDLEVEIGGESIKVGDTTAWTDILEKLPADKCTNRLCLSEKLQRTLDLAFSMTPSEIEAGCRDSGLTIEQVFACS